MKILKIFDNGGASIDRYTIVTDERVGIYYQGLGISENPEKLQGGFSQWVMFHPDYLNTGAPGDIEIQFSDLPEIAQKHVLQKMGRD